MSLTIPDSYKLSNLNENWVCDLTSENKNCLIFDGNNDYIDFGNILGTYTSFTLEAWINPSNVSGTKQLINRGIVGNTGSGDNTSFVFTLESDDLKVFWEYTTGGGTAGADESDQTVSDIISANEWTHVCVTRNNDDNKVRFYKNGALVKTSTSTNDPDGGDSSGMNLRIGATQSGTSDYNGKMAHVRIWNVARTDDQINYFKDHSIDPTHGNLKGYWKLNEGSGSSVYDSSSGNNTGTITGATWGLNQFTKTIHSYGLAFKDTTIDDRFYHGAILNKGIRIRESINLANSTSNTSGINLKIADFKIEGDSFYKEINTGSHNFLNKDIRIFSQPNNASSLSDCVQIYSGRLIKVSLDEKGITNLQVASRNPWDFIKIPNTKSTTNNIYFPVVYGNYTPETSTDASPQFCTSAITHPIPKDTVLGENIKMLVHADTETDGTDSDSRVHYYEPNYDIYVPVDPADDTADSYGGGGAVNAPITLLREFKTRDYEVDTAQTTFSNTQYLFTDTSDYATAQLQVVNGSSNTVLTDNKEIYLDFKKPDGRVTNLRLQFDYILDRGAIALSGSPDEKHIKIIDDSEGINDELSSFEMSNTHTNPFTGSISANLENPNTIRQIKLDFRMRLSDTASTVNHATYDVKVKNIVLTVKCELDRSGEPDAVANRLDDIKELYSGSDGHDKSYTDGSGVVQTGIEAHRDLLSRYTSYDEPDSQITNWSSGLNINSLRSAWNIRYWCLKPKSLKRTLEMLQKEFAFIFKWRADGSGSYWAVKDSYSSGDVVATLNSNDIKNLKINTTPFNELLTKMDISYNYHPAKETYLSTLTSEDSTNNVRRKYNIQEKENIESVDLKMNFEKAGNADVGAGGSDPNDGYADYYLNIFGDVRKIISCDIVNHTKGYLIEAGDVIQFSNTAGEMPVNPFGGNWSNYFMVTEVSKGIGITSIVCREVG